MVDLRQDGLAAEAVIGALGLAPHPEGGHYRETWRAQAPVESQAQAEAGHPQWPRGVRGASTAILFLLARGERSHWHRVDADEIWIWQAGAALTLGIAAPGAPACDTRLGPDLSAGQRLGETVPAGHWQAARSEGAWSLVCCVVAPAFSFEGFELAPPGWSPPGSQAAT